jgi:hypothetical protein
MLARDQSRTPPGRSNRLTSSPVNGAYFARHVQKSLASCSSDSAPATFAPQIAINASKATRIFIPRFPMCAEA